MNSQRSKPPGDPAKPADAGQPAELSLEDTAAQQRRGLAVRRPVNPLSGYNPYDAAPDLVAARGMAAAKEPRKHTDLRKLSDWIRVQRQVADLKEEDDKPK